MRNTNYISSTRIPGGKVCKGCIYTTHQIFKFGTRRDLNVYKKKEHLCTPNTVKLCTMCDLKFETLGSLNIHKRKEHLWAWGRFNCPQCPSTEETVDGLVNHMKQENHSLNQSISCPRCSKTCEIAQLASHYMECAKNTQGKVNSQNLWKNCAV